MQDTFDFVIVGGGTAGLVLANRLTEDPSVAVLVLEAGQNRLDDPKITTPGLVSSLFGDPSYDWDFCSVPQPELYDRRVGQPRGKVLGGSSAINILALVYPSRAGMDAWAKLGNRGWDWEGMAPYLRKFNTVHEPSDAAFEGLVVDYLQPSNYGSSGPIHSSFPDFFGPLSKAWIETFRSLGLDAKDDPMSGFYSGGLTVTSSIDPKTSERSYAGNAYYAPVAHRPNLTLIVECVVKKLELEQAELGKVIATGVHATLKDGTSTLFKASKDVLLCAGALQSPQILELSGIGNPDILEKHRIKPIIKNIYVGENLQDHTTSGMSFEVVDGYPTIDMVRDPQVAEEAMRLYMATKTGPLASSFNSFSSLPLLETDPETTDISALLASGIAKPHNLSSPSEDLQHSLIKEILESEGEPSGFVGMGPCQVHLDAASEKDMFAITDPHNYFSLFQSYSYPFSRGSVHIGSPNVDDSPIVDPKYFSHPLDLELAARHLQWIWNIRNKKPLADFIKPSGATIPRDLDLSNLDLAKEHLRRYSGSFSHVCGTCSMMPESRGGVVDERLRVYGVDKLRVVDASIFPLIPKVNIQATVYAVAEKAADIIKEDNA